MLLKNSYRALYARGFKSACTRSLDNKHTWVMSVLYIMTFGSFIGFAAAFPLSIQVIFGYSHIMIDGVMTHNTPNPNGPSALTYAWIAPFIGALIRPVGGWLSDKLGGALVTQICALIMVICALGAAYYMRLAYQSEAPEQYFMQFFLLFLGLFAASGIGNGSTFVRLQWYFRKNKRVQCLVGLQQLLRTVHSISRKSLVSKSMLLHRNMR